MIFDDQDGQEGTVNMSIEELLSVNIWGNMLWKAALGVGR